MRFRSRHFFAWVVLVFTLPAVADTLTLDNGDRLSGKVVALEAGKLVFETPYAGKVYVPWRVVKGLESEAKVRVQLSDGTLLNGRLLPAPDGRARVKVGELVETAPFTLDKVTALNPPKDRHKVKLKGRANVGGTLVRGNTEESSFHADGEVVARTPTNRYTLGGEVNEAAKNGTTTTSNWRMYTKYDHFLRDKVYLYANGLFESDGQADLNLRTSLGMGAGRQFFEEEEQNLSLEGGLSYVNEDYDVAADRSFPSLRGALKYDQLFWEDQLQFFHVSELLLSLTESDDYLLKTRTGVRIPVGKALTFNTQLNLDYDNRPAPGKDSTDRALIFSMGYGF